MGSRTFLLASAISPLLMIPGEASAQAVRTEFDRPAGVYRIFYDDGTGAEQVIEVTPSTLIAPELRSTFSRDDRGVIHYRYRVANGDGARQYIQSVSVLHGIGTTIVATPDGWRGESLVPGSRSHWYKVVGDGTVGGIGAGEALDFSIVSTALPGPARAELRGDGPVLTVPPGLTWAAMRALEQLSARNFASVSVIAPVVPPGYNEPELSRAVFLARLEQKFAREFARSHPRGGLVLRMLTEARRVYTESATTADGDAALGRLLESLRNPPGDAWAVELQRALAMGIEHVLASQMPGRSR